MSKFTRVFLIGPMGAGKTTIGMKLSPMLQWNFIDLDLLLEQQQQCSMTEIIQNYGEHFFRSAETLLFELSVKKTKMVFATGGGCILHADTRDLLQQRGIVCYLKVSPQEQLRRLVGDTTRPLLPENPVQRLEYLEKSLQHRAQLYESCADIVIDTESASIDELAFNLKQCIASSIDAHN